MNMTDLAVLVLWNVTALIALSVALVSLGGALADWEYIHDRRLNGVRTIQAGANLRTQVTRALVALLFMLIGALALVEAPWRTEISRWLLIAASMVLSAGSVWDWFDRRRIVRLLVSDDRRADREHEL